MARVDPITDRAPGAIEQLRYRGDHQIRETSQEGFLRSGFRADALVVQPRGDLGKDCSNVVLEPERLFRCPTSNGLWTRRRS